MSLKSVKKHLEKYCCPNCGDLGLKLQNIKGMKKCNTDSCNVDKFYVEGVTTRFSLFDTHELPTCDACGKRLTYDKNGRTGCNNTDCRVKESRHV